jgi:hypothetical protein
MAYLTDFQYYDAEVASSAVAPEETNWGSYQYVSLMDIVNNFMLMHTGNHSLVNNEERYKVLFHAKRAVQELNYDAFNEIKTLELKVCDNLRFILPPDYVNWVRISMYKNGVLYPLNENRKLNGARAYLQSNDCKILFDGDGNVLEPEFSKIDLDRLDGSLKSEYINEGHPYNGFDGYCIDGCWYFDLPIGGRYGLETETANANPTFRIDKSAGVINFSSDVAEELVILEYVSDGMQGGDNSVIRVNKMFEDYIYAHIRYEILDSKLGVQEYIVDRARRKKRALLRNARIRMSNINPRRLLMALRGQHKWLK